MRVAVIHDWLVTYSGAERVLEQILKCYPGSDVITLVDFLPTDERLFLGNSRVIVSGLQKLPFAKKNFRTYLQFMPYFIEDLDLTEYDLVISSSWAFAKGVIVGPDQPHVSYIHTPIRYTSSLRYQYLREAGLTKGLKSIYAKSVFHKLKKWDATSTNGVDKLIANSNYIARRIKKTYRREADVIYPPVEIDSFPIQDIKEDYYVCVSRLVHYKMVDLLVDTFNAMPERKLVVIGGGKDVDRMRAKAKPNVTIAGYQSDDYLVESVRNAKAFIMVAEEDFGIVVAEAQAAGTPVLCYARGGAPEIIVTDPDEGMTGMVFDEQTSEAIEATIVNFEATIDKFDPLACRRNAERFAPERFRAQFSAAVVQTLKEAGMTVEEGFVAQIG